MNPLLKATQLRHGSKDCPRLIDVDLRLDSGDHLALLGVNGAGKSTLMQILAGVLRPDGGEVLIQGQSLHAPSPAIRRHIGYLPQRVALYPQLTVWENMLWAAQLHAVAKPALHGAIEHALRQMGLLDVRKRLAGRLSGGMAQRLGLAQAILHKPDILILDEPTAGLDPMQTMQIRELLKAQASACSLILATHVLDDVSALCNRVILLDGGRKIDEQAVTEDTDLLQHFQRLTSTAEAVA